MRRSPDTNRQSAVCCVADNSLATSRNCCASGSVLVSPPVNRTCSSRNSSDQTAGSPQISFSSSSREKSVKNRGSIIRANPSLNPRGKDYLAELTESRDGRHFRPVTECNARARDRNDWAGEDCRNSARILAGDEWRENREKSNRVRDCRVRHRSHFRAVFGRRKACRKRRFGLVQKERGTGALWEREEMRLPEKTELNSGAFSLIRLSRRG